MKRKNKRRIGKALLLTLLLGVVFLGARNVANEVFCKLTITKITKPDGTVIYPVDDGYDNLSLEEKLQYKINTMRKAGWSEEAIQRNIPKWRKQLGLDGSSGDSTSAASNTPSYTKEQIEAAWSETGRVEATCGTDGSISYKNSLTGETKSEKIPATGNHDYKVTDHKDATCIDDGYDTYTCTVCEATYNEVLPADGEHVYSIKESIAATCTEDGLDTVVCDVCGDTYTNTIPATGHKESEPVVTKEAGWFSEGVLTTTCETCGEVLSTEVIPQTCPLPLGAVCAIAAGILAVVMSVIFFIRKKRPTTDDKKDIQTEDVVPEQ